MSWTDARSECYKVGGVLATITNAQIDALIASAAGGFDAWIGLNDLDQVNNWVWDKGLHDALQWNKDTSYNHFQPGEPNGNNGRCVAYNKNGWYVKDCASPLSFVCSMHAYNLDYDPGSENEGHLPR